MYTVYNGHIHYSRHVLYFGKVLHSVHAVSTDSEMILILQDHHGILDHDVGNKINKGGDHDHGAQNGQMRNSTISRTLPALCKCTTCRTTRECRKSRENPTFTLSPECRDNHPKAGLVDVFRISRE